ncbi:MAG: TetR/AcrR family transcriptional regulator [Acidobacteria bacterium]|nr:TetR/AcrR family transcriptional regulator [Acidobacteriota bacterium]MBV9478864.1 TetR/AcrR family transcriptional regulator [Acidobacteriota bacterium]
MRGAVAVREDVRELILDATERLLVRYGYAKMTMDDLAREVGVGKGTLYLHFASKEEVVLSRIDRIVAQIVGELRAIAARKRDAGARLREMLAARVLLRFDRARGYAQSMDAMLAAIRPGLLARREKHFAAEAAVFQELLEEAARDGTFRVANPAAAAQALLIATNALLPYSLTARQLGSRRAIEERVSTLATLLVDGLRSRRKS